MIPSQSLLTVTSTTSLYEKALRGRRGPCWSQGTTAVPTNPHLRPARPARDPPLPCCSAPASAQPCSSGKGFPGSFLSCATYSGDSQAASRQCQWRAAREGQCPDGGVGLRLAHCRESLWGSNFLPSLGASLGQSLVAPRQLTRPFAFSSFPVLLRDELLPRFPFGNFFQLTVGSRGLGGRVGCGGCFKSCWRLLVPLPQSLNPFSQPCPPTHPPTFPSPPSRSQVVALKSCSGVAPG